MCWHTVFPTPAAQWPYRTLQSLEMPLPGSVKPHRNGSRRPISPLRELRIQDCLCSMRGHEVQPTSAAQWAYGQTTGSRHERGWSWEHRAGYAANTQWAYGRQPCGSIFWGFLESRFPNKTLTSKWGRASLRNGPRDPKRPEARRKSEEPY